MSCQLMMTLWFFILYLTSKGSWCLKAMEIQVPEAAKSGSSVTLVCDYDLEQAALYTIKWYIGDEEFYRYVPKESPPSRVFPMPHINVDVSRSDARKVTLRAVQRELTGYYQCEVSADAPLFHTDIRRAFMTVAEVPLGEPILRVESQKIEIGDKIRANCTSPASYPPSNITWFVNSEKVTDGGIHSALVSPTLYHSDVALGLDSSRSSIELLATAGLFINGKAIIKCKATVFGLWEGVVTVEVLEDTPHLAPVMGPTAPQHGGEQDSVKASSEIVSNRSLSRTMVSQFLITLHFASLLLTVR